MSSATSNPAPAPEWHDAGVAEKYKQAENATRPFAKVLVEKAKLEDHEGEISVFDLACGTGAVEVELYEHLKTSKRGWEGVKVLGGDISEPMLEYLKERGTKEGWEGLETEVVDGGDIKLAPASYTHLFVNFGIFAMPTATLSACAALVRPNGFIGLSSWARIGVYPLIARAVSRLASPPKFPTEAEMMKVLTQDRAWDSPAYITQVLEEAGFTGVEAEEKTARVNNLTPAVFCETMDLMLGFVEKAWAWEEGVRAEVAASLRKVAVEEAGGEEEIVWVDFKGIVATGRKA